MDLVEELREDFLMCHICFEEYREPKQLPCLHTFCRQCLSRYIVGKVVETGAEWFPCPFCRKAIQPTQGGEVKTWADTFPTNFLLSQLSCKLQNKATGNSDGDRDDVTTESDVTPRAKCPEHPQCHLVGYCAYQRRGVCEECCTQKHSDCIRSHVRERDSRLMAEERRGECQEYLGALQIKLEGIKDTLKTRETHLTTRKEQVQQQTHAALSDAKTKFDLFILQQRRELSERLESYSSNEQHRLNSAKDKTTELSTSTDRMSKKLDSLADVGLSVKDLVQLDKVHAELARHEQVVERLRKECFPADLQFYPGDNLDKVLKGLSLGTLTAEGRSRGLSEARPRPQRYLSDPRPSSGSHYSDHDHRGSADTTTPTTTNSNSSSSTSHHGDAWVDPRRPGPRKDRAMSPSGAAAAAVLRSSSPSTADGPDSTPTTTTAATDYNYPHPHHHHHYYHHHQQQQQNLPPSSRGGGDPHHHHRRRSETPASSNASSSNASNVMTASSSSLSSATHRRTPSAGPDFGAVLIEESRRSRSVPRRQTRPLSESASMSASTTAASSSSSSSAPRRRRSGLMETALDGSSENSGRGGGGGGERSGSSVRGPAERGAPVAPSPLAMSRSATEFSTESSGGGVTRTRPERGGSPSLASGTNAAATSTSASSSSSSAGAHPQHPAPPHRSASEPHHMSSDSDLSSVESGGQSFNAPAESSEGGGGRTSPSSYLPESDARDRDRHADCGRDRDRESGRDRESERGRDRDADARDREAEYRRDRERDRDRELRDSTTGTDSDSETGVGGASAGGGATGGSGGGSGSGSQPSRRIVCVRHFLASHASDVKTEPGLVGVSSVARDRLAVCDRWNKVVKLLDISGRVLDVLAVSGDAEPWDLALRRPGALAVTYPKEQKIRMVDVVDGSTRMYYRSHFMTRDGYASLATFDSTSLAASVCPPFGSPKIHIIDYLGTVLRAIDCVNVAYPRCVDVCDGEQICVSDWTHHNVKVFTRDGSSTKFTYSGVPGTPDVQLKAPMGVAWDGRGHVFIVDGKTAKLHAVSTATGQCSAVFSLPQAVGAELKLVTFVEASPELCRSERALVVTTTSGAVQVYNLCTTF